MHGLGGSYGNALESSVVLSQDGSQELHVIWQVWTPLIILHDLVDLLVGALYPDLVIEAFARAVPR